LDRSISPQPIDQVKEDRRMPAIQYELSARVNMEIPIEKLLPYKAYETVIEVSCDMIR
jgi:hypothetical protein